MATLELSRIELPESIRQFVEQRRRHYPTATALLVPTLMECQKYYGQVTPEAALAVSELLGVPYVEVQSVVSFYTMLLKRPVGKYVIGVCRTWNCQHAGAHGLIEQFCERYNCRPGDIVKDGLLTIMEVECLCDCHNAPSAQFLKFGHEFQAYWCNNLTPQIFTTVLTELEQGQGDALRERLVRIEDKLNPPDNRRWVWIVTTNNQYPAAVEMQDGSWQIADAFGKLAGIKDSNPKLYAELQAALKQ